MLIGCRRQFYDVDFLTEQRRSTTTRRWAEEVRIRCVPYKQAIITDQRGGVHRKSRATRIVVSPLCACSGCQGLGRYWPKRFPRTSLVRDGCSPVWSRRCEYKHGAAGAGKIHKSNLRPSTPGCCLHRPRMPNPGSASSSCPSCSWTLQPTFLFRHVEQQ